MGARFGWLAGLALTGIAAVAVPASAQTVTPATVTIAGGAINGTTTAGVTAFKGIPYAAAPVGDNRWRAPQPVTPWTGTRDAGTYGADCAQAPFPPDSAPIRTQPAEDCLFANVWMPASARPGAKLPVMVWVHGGGFVNGGTSPAVYDGSAFARDGVVLVSVNYRLGRFGFFAHPALAAEGFGGNFGFLDQIAALKWVQANVAAFGGDPARVTVFGESAGGMSMHMLLQSPLARGLFAGAIIESGGGRDRILPMPTMAQAAQAGETFAPGLDAGALRALNEARVTGDLSMMTMGKPGYSGPIVDGRTIMGQSVEAIRAGLYADVPVIVGANSADGFPMVTDKAAILGAFGADAEEARRLYDPQGTASGLNLGTMTSADAMFIEPARAVARELARRGGKAWLYRFAHNGAKFGTAIGGAPHASEIPYVFATQDVRGDALPSPADAGVAAAMHRYWVNFARTGRPDGDGAIPGKSVPWPQASADDTSVQLIASDGARHVEDPRRASVDFAERRATTKK